MEHYREDNLNITPGSSATLSADVRGLTSVTLQTAEVPNTIYNITNDGLRANNVIRFQESVDLSATLTPGFYTTTSLMAEIGTQMTAASAALGSGWTYTATFSTSTLRVTISSGGGGNFAILATDPLCTTRKIIGFSRVQAAAGTQKGDAAVALSYPEYLLVGIDGVSLAESRYLAKIQMPASGGNIQYNSINTAYPSRKIAQRGTCLSRVTLRLYDPAGLELDITAMNGGAWSCTLGWKYEC